MFVIYMYTLGGSQGLMVQVHHNYIVITDMFVIYICMLGIMMRTPMLHHCHLGVCREQ